MRLWGSINILHPATLFVLDVEVRTSDLTWVAYIITVTIRWPLSFYRQKEHTMRSTHHNINHFKCLLAQILEGMQAYDQLKLPVGVNVQVQCNGYRKMNTYLHRFPINLSIAVQFCLPPGMQSPGKERIAGDPFLLSTELLNKLTFCCVAVISNSEGNRNNPVVSGAAAPITPLGNRFHQLGFPPDAAATTTQLWQNLR